MLELKQSIDVAKAAALLGVSERRVRTLLLQGRMGGYKDGYGHWFVRYPLQILPGKRGPDLHRYPTRITAKKPTLAKRIKKISGKE